MRFVANLVVCLLAVSWTIGALNNWNLGNHRTAVALWVLAACAFAVAASPWGTP